MNSTPSHPMHCRAPSSALLPLVIIGSGGFGREVRWLADCINSARPTFNLLGFVNTDAPGGGEVEGLPVWGKEFFDSSEHQSIGVAIGIGHPATKRRVVYSLPKGVSYPNLIHPSVLSSSRIQLAGHGIIITAGNILTTNVTLHDHVMVNLSCTIGHDVVVGPYSVLSPGVHVSGCVRIGEGVSVGTGTAITEGQLIGDWSVVGAGAVVNREVPANTTVVGVPASVIKTREAGWQLA